MQARFSGIVLAGALFAFSGFASDRMITNDDLERKYPPEEEPTGAKAQQWLDRSEQYENDCSRLLLIANEARRDVYHETDKDRKQDKLDRYNSTYAEYAAKCRRQGK